MPVGHTPKTHTNECAPQGGGRVCEVSLPLFVSRFKALSPTGPEKSPKNLKGHHKGSKTQNPFKLIHSSFIDDCNEIPHIFYKREGDI